MVKFSLPSNSKVQVGKKFSAVGDLKGADSNYFRNFEIYRWQPSSDSNQSISSALPRYDQFTLNTSQLGPMVLDALISIKNDIDTTLAFRRSCREGVCGSCAMNIDGVNTLACIKPIAEVKGTIKINPLPHMPVVKDLIPDLTHAYKQHASVQPWLKNDSSSDSVDETRERLQSPQERAKLDGLWECVLCFCCSTSCPSYWWNSEEYLGPATLLQSYRWIQDSRDEERSQRLENLNDEMKLYRCHTIMNCAKTCPKGLNPAKAISEIKQQIVKEID